MDNWVPFMITLMLIGMVAIVIMAARFLRRLYYMFEEIDARLIQIRNLIETGSPLGKRKPKPPAQQAVQQAAQQAVQEAPQQIPSAQPVQQPQEPQQPPLQQQEPLQQQPEQPPQQPPEEPPQRTMYPR